MEVGNWPLASFDCQTLIFQLDFPTIESENGDYDVLEAGLITVWVPLCSQFCLCSSNFGPLASLKLVCLPHTNICSLFVCLLEMQTF